MTVLKAIGLMAALGVVSTATAQSDDVLREAVRQAVATHPEVTARLHAYQAGADAVDVARAGLRPRLTLEGRAGRTEDRIDGRSPATGRLDQTGLALTLNQLLWDGQATARELRRSERDRAVRWHELADATELMALEVTRAYVDVQRMRRLVALAEDNYVQHRYAEGRLRERVDAGVSPSVDLEQADARVALAETNLSTERANLHDVSARYQRLVGQPPPQGLPELLTPALPARADEVLAAALRDNAAIGAAVENLRAQRAAAEARSAAHHPRVEARVRGGVGHHFDGVPGQQRDTTAELVLSWNLYNGGADQARVRQGANLLAEAADQRDRTCRDVRQTAAIAYNDVRTLTEIVAALDRNTLAIEKARVAYRQQFESSRAGLSLLDLLNAENEAYTAQRALANAEADLNQARWRTLASMQALGPRLGAAVPAPPPPAAVDTRPDDQPGRCPAELVALPPSELRVLDQRADRLIKAAPPLALPPATR